MTLFVITDVEPRLTSPPHHSAVCAHFPTTLWSTLMRFASTSIVPLIPTPHAAPKLPPFAVDVPAVMELPTSAELPPTDWAMTAYETLAAVPPTMRLLRTRPVEIEFAGGFGTQSKARPRLDTPLAPPLMALFS